MLGLAHHDLSRVMVKKRGDRVEAGELLAAKREGLPFLHKPCRSPVTGRLVAIRHGWVVIETEGKAEEELTSEGVDLRAFVPGRVTSILDQRSVTIETVGAYIVGACGGGGEGNGVLQVLVENPSDILTAGQIGMEANHAILVGGAGISPDALERAGEMQVKGIIVGGISSSLCALIPHLSFPIVATEGYGNLPMSSIAFNILKQHAGREASLSGQAGSTEGDSRPVIIVPLTEHQSEMKGALPCEDAPVGLAQIGHQVRVTRRPLLGRTGEIISMPVTPQQVPSGLSLPGAQVVLKEQEQRPSWSDVISTQDGSYVPPGAVQFIPWLNLEHIFGS
ncbi:MAG: hypothetical protein Kow0063_26370 [Anaerolineae bacterium]